MLLREVNDLHVPLLLNRSTTQLQGYALGSDEEFCCDMILRLAFLRFLQRTFNKYLEQIRLNGG
jgi:hypothetical protein